MATFFTADTHFGHGAIRALLKRPFPDTPAMDAALAQAWNDAVAPGDEVWHLGDFAVGNRDPGGLLDRLHGTKRLIAGNNDPPAIRALPGWAEVREFAEVAVDGHALVLCHYPLRSWRAGAVNLHGHSHGRLAPLPRQHDVGVDARGFRPVRLADLIRPRRARPAVAA